MERLQEYRRRAESLEDGLSDRRKGYVRTKPK
jgi:hypothetical protein